MRLSYVLKLALKNLVGYKMRSILTIMGVGISIGFVCVLLAFGFGLQKVSTDQIANIDDLRMIDINAGKSKIVSIDENTIKKISDLSEVTEIYPQVGVASNIKYGSSRVDGVTYGRNRNLIDLEKPTISSGKLYSGNSNDEALINVTAARKLGVSDPATLIGKEVTVKLVLRPELFSAKDTEPKFEDKQLKIVGIINEGTTPYIYVPLSTITKYGVDRYSAAKIKLANKDMVDKVKPQIEHMGFKVSSIKETVDQVNQFFNIFRIVLIAFGSVAILVAMLGMFNTMTISLMEKTREVGLMKLLGTQRKHISRIFVAESIIIGLIGGVSGMVISLGFGALVNAFVSSLAVSSGNEAVTLFYFPIKFVFIVIALSILISLLTGLYPSRRATKISPLDALRYE